MGRIKKGVGDNAVSGTAVPDVSVITAASLLYYVNNGHIIGVLRHVLILRNKLFF